MTVVVMVALVLYHNQAISDEKTRWLNACNNDKYAVWFFRLIVVARSVVSPSVGLFERAVIVKQKVFFFF